MLKLANACIWTAAAIQWSDTPPAAALFAAIAVFSALRYLKPLKG